MDGKKHAVVMVEIVKKKRGKTTINRAYAKAIDNFKSKTLEIPMITHISLDSRVKADGFSSYVRLIKKFPKWIQALSNKGKSMPEFHDHIMNIKNCIIQLGCKPLFSKEE